MPKEQKRELVAEWWEIVWDKPGEKRCRIEMYSGGGANLLIPRGAYADREYARKDFRIHRRYNKYYKLVHVKRYRTVKK